MEIQYFDLIILNFNPQNSKSFVLKKTANVLEIQLNFACQFERVHLSRSFIVYNKLEGHL